MDVDDCHYASDIRLLEMYLRSSSACALVYSVNSRDTFTQVREMYGRVNAYFIENENEASAQDVMPDTTSKGKRKPLLVGVVGTQCDGPNERQVSTAEGRRVALELGCPFWETSADRTNVDEAFVGMAVEYKEAVLRPLISVPEVLSPAPSLTEKVERKLNEKTPLKERLKPWKRLRLLRRQPI